MCIVGGAGVGPVPPAGAQPRAPALTRRPNRASLLVRNENLILLGREVAERTPRGDRGCACSRCPPIKWDEAVDQALAAMLPPERRNPRDASNALATFVNHPALHEGISPVQRPPPVFVHAAAAHPRAGHPAGRASSRLRLRVDPSRDHGETRGISRRRDRRGPTRRRRPTNSSARSSPGSTNSTRSPVVRRDLGGARLAPGRSSADGLRSSPSAATRMLAMAFNTFGVELDQD